MIGSAAQRREIANNLRIARNNAGYTQAEVATHIGVHESTISAYEITRSLPTSETFVELCNLYGVRVHDMLPPEMTL